MENFLGIWFWGVLGGFLFQLVKRKRFCQLAVGRHTFSLCGVLKKTVIHNLKRAVFNICQKGRKHRGSVEHGAWQPLAPSLARPAVLRATGPWEQEDTSATLEKISALRHSLGSGCSVLPARARDSDFSRFCWDVCLQGRSATCQGRPCLLPGTAGSVAWAALSSWGAALLSDPCFATWLLRIGVATQSFLREMCCSVHQEFWLGVSSNAGLNNKFEILNNLRPCFDSFPKVIPQILWLRYRRLLEQVLCFKPQSW